MFDECRTRRRATEGTDFIDDGRRNFSYEDPNTSAADLRGPAVHLTRPRRNARGPRLNTEGHKSAMEHRRTIWQIRRGSDPGQGLFAGRVALHRLIEQQAI